MVHMPGIGARFLTGHLRVVSDFGTLSREKGRVDLGVSTLCRRSPKCIQVTVKWLRFGGLIIQKSGNNQHGWLSRKRRGPTQDKGRF